MVFLLLQTKQKGKSNGKNDREELWLPAIFLSGSFLSCYIYYLGAGLPCWISICLANNSKSSSFHCSSCLLQLTPRPISISSLLMSDVPWEVLLKRKFMTKVSPAFNPSAYPAPDARCSWGTGQVMPTSILPRSHWCSAALTKAWDLWKSSNEQLGRQTHMSGLYLTWTKFKLGSLATRVLVTDIKTPSSQSYTTRLSLTLSQTKWKEGTGLTFIEKYSISKDYRMFTTVLWGRRYHYFPL